MQFDKSWDLEKIPTHPNWKFQVRGASLKLKFFTESMSQKLEFKGGLEEEGSN